MTSEPTILLDVVEGTLAGDDEFLALGALRLEPVLHTAGSVRLVLALRDDAFKPEAAGVLQHGLAVGLDVLAVADGPARRQVIEAAGQERLAIDEGHVRKVVAAEIQDIEGVERHPVG